MLYRAFICCCLLGILALQVFQISSEYSYHKIVQPIEPSIAKQEKVRDLNIPENRPITHTTVNDIEKRQLYTEIHRLIRQEIKENVSQPLAELIALQKIINEKEQPIFSDEEFQVAQSSFQTATAQLQAHIAQGDLDESAAYELMSHYDKMTPDQRYDFSLQYADAVNKGLVNLPKHIKEYQ